MADKKFEDMLIEKGANFKKGRKGYDYDSVDTYFDEVREEVREVVTQRDKYFSAYEPLKKKLDEFEATYGSISELEEQKKNEISSMIKSSNKMYEDVVENAKNDARKIIEDAQKKGLEADSIINDAKKRAVDIVEDADIRAGEYTDYLDQKEKEAEGIIASAKKEAEEIISKAEENANTYRESLTEMQAEAKRLEEESEAKALDAASLPDEVRAEAEMIKAEAEKDAEKIINDANAEAEKIKSDVAKEAENITDAAKEEADEIRENALAEAEKVKVDAVKEVDSFKEATLANSKISAENSEIAKKIIDNANAEAIKIIEKAEQTASLVLKDANSFQYADSGATQKSELIIEDAKAKAEKIIAEANAIKSSANKEYESQDGSSVIRKDSEQDYRESLDQNMKEAGRILAEAKHTSESIMSKARVSSKTYCDKIGELIDKANNTLVLARIEANKKRREATEEVEEFVLKSSSSASATKDLFRDIHETTTTRSEEYKQAYELGVNVSKKILSDAKEEAKNVVNEAISLAQEYRSLVEQEIENSNNVLHTGKLKADKILTDSIGNASGVFSSAQYRLAWTKSLHQDVIDANARGQRYISDLDKSTLDIKEYVLQHLKDLSAKEDECLSLIKIFSNSDS